MNLLVRISLAVLLLAGAAAPAVGQTITPLGSGFSAPRGVAVDGSGNVFIGDTGNGLVKEILAADGSIRTFSNFFAGFEGNIPFVSPQGLAFEPNGKILVADPGSNQELLWEITPSSGAVGAQAIDTTPSVVASDSADDIFGNFTTFPLVRELSQGFIISNGWLGEQSALWSNAIISGVVADESGNIYLTSETETQILKVNVASQAMTLLGNGMNAPEGTAIDAAGNIYVADTGSNSVKLVFAADGAVATIATGFSQPSAVAVDSGGAVYVADTGNNAIKKIQPATAVAGVLPAAGLLVGGNTVIIEGTALTGATAVSFGGVPAVSFTVNSSTSITAVTPSGSAGTVDVTVTTPSGTSTVVPGDVYTYEEPPSVTAISPAAGPLAGGTVVTITGTNLIAASQVLFGATAATDVVVRNAVTLTATAPAGTGTVDVTVTTPSGTSPTNAGDEFTYRPPPTVTGLSPSAGPLGGGTLVTITGTNLSGAGVVSFGSTVVSGVTVNSDTSITVTAPSGTAGTVAVTVATPGGTSATVAADQYTYDALPTVTAISPSSGPLAAGAAVTITGTNFKADSAVNFGAAAAANVTVVSVTEITASAPAGSIGTVDVTVTTPGGTSVTGAADQYTYVAAPTVTAVTPSAGPLAAGTAVSITGMNLSAASAVNFGAAAATNVTVVSAALITATAPAGSVGTVDVTVTTAGGTSATGIADRYTYTAAPTVTAISPASGPLAAGTAVTITGTNLTAASAIKFGTASATNVTVVSATAITATAPAGSAGGVDVTVTTPGGTSATGAADRYTYAAAPTVTAISPSSGPLAGDTAVTITGTSLTAASAVKFGNASATNVTVVSATEITATAPAGSVGPVDVTVTTRGGTSAIGAGDQYVYRSVPAVTGLSPSSGPLAGGTSVVITGTGLAGTTAIAFGTLPAASFHVDSDSQVTAVSPASGAAQAIDVAVTTPGGSSATGAADRFTFIGQTSVALTASVNPSSFGRAVTFTAVVGSAGGAPTGTVTFKDGSTSLFTGTLANGITSYTTASLTVGSHAISVSYSGDSIFAVGSGSLTEVVNAAAATSGQTYVYQSTLGATGVAKPDTSHFSGPSGAALDSVNGHLLIADSGNQRVQVLDAGTLAVVATLGTSGIPGSDNAHFDDPTGVGVDAGSDRIFVADSGNDRVQVFDAKSFAYVATLDASPADATLAAGGLSAPGNVQVVTGRLYVADTANQRVQIFDAATLVPVATLGTSGVAGRDDAHFNAPKDAVLNPAANEILVADSGNSRVQRFDAATLAYNGTIGGAGQGVASNAYLGTPVSVSYDPVRNLILVADDSADQRVQVFDALSYNYVLTLGTTGSAGAGNSQFSNPSGLAVDTTHDRLFVADQQNDRVQVFSIAAPSLFASVLPGSRSVELGRPATIFASVVNAGTTPLQGCQVALPVTAPSGLSLSYQTTDPATNALTGTPDTPAAIDANNGVQSFLVTLQGSEAFSAPGMALDFYCLGVGPAAIETGVDTIDLAMSATPVADIIALAATQSDNGIVEIPAGGAGAFAVASSNVGATSQIIVSVDTGSAVLPLTATLCQSNPSTGACLAAPSVTVPLSDAAGSSPTFSVFLQANGTIPFAPATNRVFLRFKDAGGGLHGSTSVAVQTE